MSCGYPGSPSHASVSFTPDFIRPGTVATYECEPGFELLGPSRRLCSTNGTWTPAGIPFCGEFDLLFYLIFCCKLFKNNKFLFLAIRAKNSSIAYQTFIFCASFHLYNIGRAMDSALLCQCPFEYSGSNNFFCNLFRNTMS